MRVGERENRMYYNEFRQLPGVVDTPWKPLKRGGVIRATREPVRAPVIGRTDGRPAHPVARKPARGPAHPVLPGCLLAAAELNWKEGLLESNPSLV